MNPYGLDMPRPRPGKPEIVMAPLVDIVFLLLIFFMVTTVFPEHSGLKIEKPKSSQTALLDSKQILIDVDQTGAVFYRKRRVEVRDLVPIVREALRLNPDARVLITADRRSSVESLIAVMDAGRRGGAERIGIATDEKPPDR